MARRGGRSGVRFGGLARLAAVVAWATAGGHVAGAERVALRESARAGQVTRFAVSLRAEGTRPKHDARGRDLPFKVETHFDGLERVDTPGPGGAARRVVRRAERATVAIDAFRGAGRTMAVQLRPEVALLIAERRPEGVVTVSAGGPLLRSELDLLQGPGDPLILADLLPPSPVGVGDTWAIGPDAIKALSEYEALATRDLRAKLTRLDDAEAEATLAGEVRGTVRGGEGTMRLDGRLIFDRRAGLVRRLELRRDESRKKGHVESAIEARSTLTVERSPIEVPPELSDEALKDLPLDVEPHRELLLYAPPGGEYQVLHDRQWHLALEDARRAVLKRIERGEPVAQCDLALAPRAGRGRHQDVEQFRDDIRRLLGEHFGSIVGAGEVGGAEGGGFRYKVAVEGKPREEGDVPLWYYYLIAGPEGDQLYAVFTLTRALEARFTDEDARVVGSLEWRPRDPDSPAPR